MNVTPYLFFDGRCEDAIAFYRSVFGAELKMLMRFRESPDPIPEGMLPPGHEDKVMHAELRVGESVIMMSDGSRAEAPKFAGFSLAYSVPDVETAERLFATLAHDGEVQMPMAETFWSPRYGAVVDRFGVSWMIMAEPAAKSA